jgi:hypothetical protein
MAWTLRTIWLDLRYGLPGMIKLGRRFIPGSRLSSSPSVDAAAQAPGVYAPGACDAPADAHEKRFYSLMIEVRPNEADAETLRLFSDVGSCGLTAALNLPDGCEIRRCMIVSADFAEMLIRM